MYSFYRNALAVVLGLAAQVLALQTASAHRVLAADCHVNNLLSTETSVVLNLGKYSNTSAASAVVECTFPWGPPNGTLSSGDATTYDRLDVYVKDNNSTADASMVLGTTDLTNPTRWSSCAPVNSTGTGEQDLYIIKPDTSSIVAGCDVELLYSGAVRAPRISVTLPLKQTHGSASIFMGYYVSGNAAFSPTTTPDYGAGVQNCVIEHDESTESVVGFLNGYYYNNGTSGSAKIMCSPPTREPYPTVDALSFLRTWVYDGHSTLPVTIVVGTESLASAFDWASCSPFNTGGIGPRDFIWTSAILGPCTIGEPNRALFFEVTLPPKEGTSTSKALGWSAWN
jgi:hypothetical protein